MDTNKVKDLEQNKAINAWFAKNCRGTLELCTSFGKTLTALKAAMYFIEKNPRFRVLILTPTEVIRDDTWKEEAKKWKLTKYYNKNFRTECIQTARNWENTHWDMVIADEHHNYLSPENRKFFLNNKIDRLLGLTAKIPRERWDINQQICPVVYRMTIQQARKLGIVSDYIVCNLPVLLSPQERLEYTKIQNRYTYFESRLGGKFQAFRTANLWKKNGTAEQKSIANGFYRYMRARTNLLYNASNKINVVNQILDYHLFEDKMAIVFTQSKQVAHDISDKRDDTVHYYAPDNKDKDKGIYLSKDDRKANLNRFNDNRTKIRVMSCVKALNEGVNVPKISLNIIHSGTSSDKDFIQRVGRTVRLADEGKLAVIINLYVPGSQEENWVNKRLGKFKDDAEWINSLGEIDQLIQ